MSISIETIAELLTAHNVASKALDHYNLKTGNHQGQVDMCIEECSELIKALLKHRRAKHRALLSKLGTTPEASIREELADVQIMVFQMMMLFGWTESMEALAAKAKRLGSRILRGEQ